MLATPPAAETGFHSPEGIKEAVSQRDQRGRACVICDVSIPRRELKKLSGITDEYMIPLPGAVSIPRRELKKLSGAPLRGKPGAKTPVSIPRRELKKLSGERIGVSYGPYCSVSIPRRELKKLSAYHSPYSGKITDIKFPFPGGN